MAACQTTNYVPINAELEKAEKRAIKTSCVERVTRAKLFFLGTLELRVTSRNKMAALVSSGPMKTFSSEIVSGGERRERFWSHPYS